MCGVAWRPLQSLSRKDFGEDDEEEPFWIQGRGRNAGNDVGGCFRTMSSNGSSRRAGTAPTVRCGMRIRGALRGVAGGGLEGDWAEHPWEPGPRQLASSAFPGSAPPRWRVTVRRPVCEPADDKDSGATPHETPPRGIAESARQQATRRSPDAAAGIAESTRQRASWAKGGFMRPSRKAERIAPPRA